MTTTPTPNLQVPQRTTAVRRSGGGGLASVLLLCVIGLQVWSMLRDGGSSANVSVEAAAAAPAADERALAMKLEDRNLPDAAVDAWEKHLAQVSLEARDEAAIRYRMGKLLQQGQRYQEAVGTFYRAEQLLGEDGGDLNRQITIRVRECLSKLGQYSDLSREMAARAEVSDDDTSLKGRQVVAEIGDEKIRVSDFDRMLTEQIEQMVAMQGGVSDADAAQMRRQAHARYADPQARVEQLQQFVASRILADEARKQGLEDSPAFRRQLVESAERLLASRLLIDEVGKRGTVTPQDVDRFYAANVDRYAEPTTASIAHVLCATEEEAREVIEAARSGGDFAELARTRSLDTQTKSDGGALRRPVTDGRDFVPGIGQDAAAYAAIMAAARGSVLVEPYKSDAGWHVVKVTDRTERLEKSFDDVRDLVERDARAARREEATQQYIRELFEVRGVKFYPQAFVGEETGGSSSNE